MTTAPVAIGSHAGLSRRVRSEDKLWRWLMLGPALTLLAALTVLPLIELLVLSFNSVTWQNASPILSSAGLQNFIALLKDTLFHTSILNTLVFVAAAVSIEVLLGLGLALAVGSVRRGRDFYTTAFMLPILLPGIVIGAIWALMYNPDFGIINTTLDSLGLQQHDWLGNPNLALGSIVAVDVWHWTPFCFLLLFAAVESLPIDVFEAARIDGAGAWQRCWHIALPLLTPAIMVVLAFRAIIAFKVFDEVYLLTSGGPGTATEVISLTIYRRFFVEDQAGTGAAMSVAAFLVLGGVTLAVMTIIWRRRARS